MVPVRRDRERPGNLLYRPARRGRARPSYPATRVYGRPLYPVGRAMGCVLVGATAEALSGAWVIAGQPVERSPRHRVPARLVGAVTHHGLVNEASIDKLARRPLHHVMRFPAALLHVCGGCQQPAVVVAHELARELHQERARGVAQAGVRGAVEHGPWQCHKPT